MDINFGLEHAPAVKPAVKHVVQAAPVIVKQGYTMLNMAISAAVASGLGFGLGWYIKGRGMAGVQIDLTNIKNDVENLKAKVFPSATPATPAAA